MSKRGFPWLIWLCVVKRDMFNNQQMQDKQNKPSLDRDSLSFWKTTLSPTQTVSTVNSFGFCHLLESKVYPPPLTHQSGSALDAFHRQLKKFIFQLSCTFPRLTSLTETDSHKQLGLHRGSGPGLPCILQFWTPTQAATSRPPSHKC